MKKIYMIAIVSTLHFTGLCAQQIEFDFTPRINNNIPRLELYDTGDSRLECILEENADYIWLKSLNLGLVLDAQNDVIIRGENIKIGSTLGRTDFHFLHGSGSSIDKGFTLENNAGSQNRWTFYVKHGDGTLTLTRNDVVVGSFADNGVYTSSDRKLKKNIKLLDEVLPDILALSPSRYDYIKSSSSSKHSIGFIAQEINKYFPELVLDEPMDDGETVMQVNYAGFGVLAIKAIQEQQVQIDELKKQVAEMDTLKQEMTKLKLLLETLVVHDFNDDQDE